MSVIQIIVKLTNDATLCQAQENSSNTEGKTLISLK